MNAPLLIKVCKYRRTIFICDPVVIDGALCTVVIPNAASKSGDSAVVAPTVSQQ